MNEKPKLVIVEDNPNDVFLMKRVFTKEALDVDVEWLSDGAEAIEYFENKMKKAPALVLLDIKMPKVTGLEVLEHLKEKKETRNIPVVMLSASDQSKDRERAYRLGTNGYLVKPSGFQELKSMVSSTFDFWIRYNKTI